MMRPRGAISRAFTLPEVMLALCIVGLLMASTFALLRQYRQFFAKQEKGSDVMHQSSIFLEQLRKDVQNAAPKQGGGPADTFVLDAARKTLRFSVFAATPSGPKASEVVEYSWYRPRTILRRLGDQVWRSLVEDGVSSLTFRVEEDTFPASSPYALRHRVWIHVSGTFGGRTPTGGDAEFLTIAAKVFPVHLNRRWLSSYPE